MTSNVVNLAAVRAERAGQSVVSLSAAAPPIEVEIHLEGILAAASRAMLADAAGRYMSADFYRAEAKRRNFYLTRRGYTQEQIDAMLAALAETI